MKKYIPIAILLILAGALTLYFTSAKGEDKIAENTYIHGVAVGGMCCCDALEALQERFQPDLERQTIRYTLNNETIAEFTFADFNARLDFSHLTEQAANQSNASGLLNRMLRIIRRKQEINDPPLIIFSTERLEDNLRKISQQVDVPPLNAALFEANHGEITIKPEAIGSGVNIESAAAQTIAILQNLQSAEIQLEIITTPPAYTTEDLNFTPAVLGHFETQIYDGCEARKRNISRAAERIHNNMLYPGEVFSASAKIAAHQPDSGYEPAIVLIRGEPAQDIGGGVCQVVTTLYNAALRAELEIIQRHNHSARVSYAELGFDATVAGDYYDLKFKNTTPHPMLITTHIANNRLQIRIYGKETRQPERTLRFEARQIELIPPEPYREVIDPAIPLGQRAVTQEAQMGYRIELYKYVYINGNQTEQIKINTSHYKPLQGTIAIGAG